MYQLQDYLKTISLTKKGGNNVDSVEQVVTQLAEKIETILQASGVQRKDNKYISRQADKSTDGQSKVCRDFCKQYSEKLCKEVCQRDKRQRYLNDLYEIEKDRDDWQLDKREIESGVEEDDDKRYGFSDYLSEWCAMADELEWYE